MIKQQNIKENARSRRDARRKARQEAFAAANPMLVGRRYDVDTTPVDNRLSRIEDRTEDTSKRKIRQNRQQLHENHVRHV